MNYVEYAKEYIKAGLNVMPLFKDRKDKNKWVYAEWKHLQKEYNNPNVFYANNVDALGLICGEISGNVEVLDFDTKHDLTGTLWQDFMNAIDVNGLMPLFERLVLVRTKSNGYHIIYKCEYIEGNKKVALNKKGNAVIETRGEGGYINAIPSRGYSLIQGDLYNIPHITVSERTELFSLCAIFDDAPPKPEAKQENNHTQYNTEGGENPFIAYNAQKPTALLRDFGWVYKNTRGEIDYYSRPNSSSKDVHASLRQHGDTWVFYSFTTNCFPLEPNKGYNPVALYSAFTGKYDKKEIAKGLVSMGFGSFAKKKEQPKKEQARQEKSETTEKDFVFPFHVFPENLQRMIFEYSQKRDFSKVLLSNSILAVLSGAVGLNYEYELSNGWSGFPLLYMSMVGRASISKSPSFNFAKKPVDEWEAEGFAEFERQLNEWHVQKDAEKNKKDKEFLEPKPTRKRVLISDTTIEALMKVHNINRKGLLLFRDEQIGWLRSFNGYKGGKGSDQQNYLQIWDNLAIINDRAGREEEQYMPQSFVTVFGGIQPKVLGEFARENRQDDGFSLRFLFCFAEEKELVLSKDIRQKIDMSLYNEYSQAIKYYLNQPKFTTPQKVTFSPQSEDLFWQFYDNNKIEGEKQQNEDFSALMTKLEKYSTRLALLLQLLENIYEGDIENFIISEKNMLGALELVAYYKQTAIKALDIIQENQDLTPTNQQISSSVKWTEVFGDNTTMQLAEIITILTEKTGKSSKTIKRWVASDLIKVAHGVYKM